MQGAGILELVAELAVALLGFSGVVAVLGRRASGEWSPLDRARFFAMVRQSILVLTIALLPFPFHHGGFSPQAQWGWSSGIAAVLSILVTVRTPLPASRPSNFRSLWKDEGVSKLALVYLFFVQWAGPGVLVLNASGVFLDRAFTPYLVVVLLHFATPVILFVRLLDTALTAPSRAT